MRKGLLVGWAFVVMAGVLLAGCDGRGAGQGSPTAATPGEPPAASAAFELDSSNSAELAVKSTGGSGAAVRTGEATAAVWVPAGAATSGAVWTLTALAQAPPGVSRPVTPGIYVDTADAPPSEPCVVGFVLRGKVPKNVTIVRIADDGATSTIVPTTRLDRSGRTLLTAAVEGFSAYAVSEEPKAAIDKAFAERAKAGDAGGFTIKAGGSESQKYKGWDFEYDFGMTATGGGPEMGGVYKGSAKLSVEGRYDGPASIVKSWGTVSGIARDKKLRFIIVDAPVVSLLTGEPAGEPVVGGTGAMRLKGMGTLDMQARAPQASGQVTKKSVKGSDAVPFVIVIDGDDVRVQVPMVGVFPGKILRTTK